jgi:hypothetical protein
MGIVEQRHQIGVNRLMGGDLVRVDAAVDQQVMCFWQMVKRPDRRPEALIIVKKAKNADEHRVGGQLV